MTLYPFEAEVLVGLLMNLGDPVIEKNYTFNLNVKQNQSVSANETLVICYYHYYDKAKCNQITVKLINIDPPLQNFKCFYDLIRFVANCTNYFGFFYTHS